MTDIYLPPVTPAPVIAIRTPYGRANDKLVGTFLSFARRGYVVLSQDCRGTGDSEPDNWDYLVYEADDGFDFVDWIAKQPWADGFVGACGGSYVGQTQWPMALNPQMSAIAPEVSGLGIAYRTVRHHLFHNSYAKSVGKGTSKLPISYAELERTMLKETLASGYFNEPLNPKFPELLESRFPQIRCLEPSAAMRFLWEQYCLLEGGAERAAFIRDALGTQNVSILEIEALPSIFGPQVPHDAHTLPHSDPLALCGMLHAPALLITGWYDWGLSDTLETWQAMQAAAPERVRDQSRLIISPAAHNAPGYHEDANLHPELQRNFRTENNAWLLLRWFDAIKNRTTSAWPRVIYYLMGANEWRSADSWPLPEAQSRKLFIEAGGRLTEVPPTVTVPPTRYTFDPETPTPTVGGSILSNVYPMGSVDVADTQNRSDIVTFTSDVLEADVDLIGPLKFVLYASSTAPDTDFAVRLSDVFPGGRAIQIQNGILRARYRECDPELLTPGQKYRFEIDMWATANRFKAGHRLRIDISSADFPRYDRNTNLGGVPGKPVRAVQSIYHDPDAPSCLEFFVVP